MQLLEYAEYELMAKKIIYKLGYQKIFSDELLGEVIHSLIKSDVNYNSNKSSLGYYRFINVKYTISDYLKRIGKDRSVSAVDSQAIDEKLLYHDKTYGQVDNKSDLEYLIAKTNLTDSEKRLINLKMKGLSNVEISREFKCSKQYITILFKSLAAKIRKVAYASN